MKQEESISWSFPQMVATTSVAHCSPSLNAFIHDSICRFINKDWGDCDIEDANLNDEAASLLDGRRAIGVYKIPEAYNAPEDRIWIIGYPGDYLTVLFPSDY